MNGRASSPVLQAKLEVGPAGDRYEQEADRVAAVVMRDIRSTKVAPKGDGNESGLSDRAGSLPIRRFALSDDVRPRSAGSDFGPAAGVSRIQLKTAAPAIGAEGGAVDADTDSKIRQATGGGRPLDDGLRRSMEGGFGADFSGVRVHNDSTADELNQRIQAKAFTTGSDVFFRSGEYNPSTTAGQELVAHELTHVVQQGGAGVRRSSDTIQREGEGATATKTESTKTYGKKAKETSSDVYDGTTQTTSSTSALVGAGASLKVLEEATDTEIKDTVEFMARAGVFGEASKKKAYERGNLSLEASGKAAGFAGVQTDIKAGLTIRPSVMAALEATFAAAVKIGVGADLEGLIKGKYGPVSASLGAKLSVFAGASAEFSGKLEVGLLKTGVSGAAAAFAGAKAEGSATVTIGVGDAEISAAIEGSAMAGASAEAKGEFTIGLSGVTIQGSAEVFVGVKASVGAKGAVAYKGRTIFSASAKVEVSAGIGGKVKGGFSVSGGKIKFDAGLAAALGLGAGAEVSVELDLYALAAAVEQIIVDAFLSKKEEINRNSPENERVPLLDQTQAVKMHQLGYETMLKDFQAYEKKKSKQGEHGVKMQRVQEILDKRYPKLKESYCFLETDNGIAMAIKDVFGVVAQVQAGQIRSWEPTV